MQPEFHSGAVTRPLSAILHSEAHERKVSRDTKKSAPSQACNCQTTRSVLCEQVKQVGNRLEKALAHPSCRFHG